MWRESVQDKLDTQKKHNATVHELQEKLERTQIDLQAREAELKDVQNELLELEDEVHNTRRALCNPGIFCIVWHLVEFDIN